jgi:hypothetical protein
MELRKNRRNFCALAQELPSISLQCDEEIVNRAIDISTILTPMALDVLRVRPIDTDMHTFPSAMAASRTSRTTPMSVPVLVLFLRSHLHSPEGRCGGVERVPSGLQFMRSPLGAVPMISGATAKEMRVSSVNLARVLSSNSRMSALNSLSSINRTCLMVFPRSAGYSIPLYRYIRSFRFLCGAPQLMHTEKQGILHSTQTQEVGSNFRTRTGKFVYAVRAT